jgi:stage II sporulation protein D
MCQKMIRALFFFLGVFVMGTTAVVAAPKPIRVAVLRESGHFTIGVNGRHTITDYNSGKKVAVGIRLRPSLVALENGKIKIGGQVYDSQRLLIEPRKDATLRINKSQFRGNILIINNSGSSLTVVNFVDMEQYVRGVLYHEVSDKWPLEAIKAQAVATRTYALYAIEKYVSRDFDVTNDIYSQVYGGKTAERYRTNLAVRRTKGEVLTYRGKIFPTFFHANSGGMTEDANELWGIDLPPLKGGIESPFSVNSPHYRWTKNFRLKDIQDKLNERGYKTGLIQEIKVLERNKSGRIKNLQITSRDGKTDTIDGKTFRDVLGPNNLKSNLYEVNMKGWYVDFVGRGWGHGVGMCQWGAYNMARARYSYRQILLYYYPGADLERRLDLE